MEDIIKKWKEAKISYANFEFNCGGDSMNDTDLIFYVDNGNKIEVSSEISSYFDDDIYNHVEFYVNSDGHYLGETGTVRITLNESGDDVEYSKSSMSQYSESCEGTIECPITKEQAEFITEYISGLSKDAWDNPHTDFKKDFILTEEHENLIQELHDSFFDHAVNWQPDDVYGDVEDESQTYNISTEDSDTIHIYEKDNQFYINLNVGCRVYTESEMY